MCKRELQRKTKALYIRANGLVVGLLDSNKEGNGGFALFRRFAPLVKRSSSASINDGNGKQLVKTTATIV